ncbi:hypothetical protein AB1Y20_023303 [Prymnesium parvum]|uniref:VWFA domain-containing protein n=1 Tax=Prymnesium parvum TaxID=97485 RepID=A0AB34JGD5_PRYPA
MADPLKEALFVVLDVSASMQHHLEEAKEAVQMLVNQKILFHKQDAVGIAVMGSLTTRNTLNEEHGAGNYEQLSVVQVMAPVSFQTVSAVNDVCIADGRADLIDAMCLAMDAVIKFVGTRKFSKRVLLISDCNSPADVNGVQLDEIANQLKASSMVFSVLGVGLDAPHRTPQQEHTLAVLNALEEKVGDNFALMSLARASDLLRALKKRSVRPSTAFRGSLKIGEAHLPVWSWRKVCKTAAVQMKAVSKAALDDEEASKQPDKTVAVERRAYVLARADGDGVAADADEGGVLSTELIEREVKPEDRINAYRYGRDLVPVSSMEEEELKFGVKEKCLELLGFVPQTDVPRHVFMSAPEAVVGDPEKPDAHRAMQALIAALEEEQSVGIARYAPRAAAPPRLVCLWPARKCLWLVGLPFAEEHRAIDWPPPATPRPTAEQLDAAGALVDALTLPRDGEPLRPKDVHNPRLQRTYQCIQHRALAPSGGGNALPPPSARIALPFVPDPALFGRAAPEIRRFGEACVVSEAVEGRKRGGGGERGEAKRLRAEEGDVGVGAPLQLQSSSVVQVDSGKPVDTFWTMLNDETQDLVAKAIAEMSDVIRNLLKRAESAADQFGMKAFACLRELRTGSVHYEEPEAYNALLHELKSEYDESAKSHLWHALKEDVVGGKGHGLITRDETEESEVSVEEAKAFWGRTSAPTQDMPAEAEEQEEEEDEYGDLV